MNSKKEGGENDRSSHCPATTQYHLYIPVSGTQKLELSTALDHYNYTGNAFEDNFVVVASQGGCVNENLLPHMCKRLRKRLELPFYFLDLDYPRVCTLPVL